MWTEGLPHSSPVGFNMQTIVPKVHRCSCLALTLRTNSSQRCSTGFRQDSQVHPHQSLSSVSMDFALCPTLCHVWSGPLQTVSTGSGAWNCPKCHSSFHRNSWKTTLHHNSSSTKLHTWHSVVLKCSMLPGTSKPRLVQQIARWKKSDSSLERMRLHCSAVQWRRALHHCIRRIALHSVMHGLDAAALPWKPIPRSSLRAMVWANLKATWNLDWLCKQSATSLQYASVSSRGLPLCGRVAFIPKLFHFLIIKLSADRGIFRSEEISQLDLLHSWQPMKVSHWNSPSS